ncbi:hypothetical protein EV197_0719 [Aquimarina brevivitae]|uniref:Uncharacterized protein n=1 Tax=Aquimarina brevivitae TaxID=323412 RepID=A0A4V2F7E1_9FLAO|nr:hypothetical protein EV197_0719 [Aquimarina brevivitae]
MIKSILNLEGVKKLNKREKLTVNGGDRTDYEICLSTCAGTCNIFGRCFYHIK